MADEDNGNVGKAKRKKRDKKGSQDPSSPPLLTISSPKEKNAPAQEDQKNTQEIPKKEKKKQSNKEKRKSNPATDESANDYESNEGSGAEALAASKPKKNKKKLLSLKVDSPGVISSGSSTNTAPLSNAPPDDWIKIDNKWTIRRSVDKTAPAYKLNLKRYNDIMRQTVIDGDDFSAVYGLRRSHSEPSFTRDLSQRIELRPGTPLRDKCPSMEDLILTQDGYPELMLEHSLDEEDSRQYDVSADMMVEWNTLLELEKTRYSFFDELFASGFVVDSMEVPGKEDDIDYLVEAEESDFRNKVDYARVVFKTKNVFTGNMVDWYFTGEGRYCWVDGTTYQGSFKQGVMEGDGIILWTDGSIYQGEFIQGIRNGYGIYSTAEGYTYAGDWYRGLPQGKGRMWYDPTVDDSDFYDGEWQKCVPHGFGTRQYINGDRYVGEHENGIRVGKGTMTWLEERQVYKGMWKSGFPHGTGTHTWYLPRTSGSDFPTRHVYKGDWEMGMKHGVGRQIYACGSIYEGRWIRGQRHGKGVFVNPAGEVIFGLFRYGSLAGGADVPLHTPTYQCNFDNLVRTISKTIYITPGTESLQENALHETVIRFLPQIRKLFKRAGYLGESWDNQGKFPKWMEKVVAHNVHTHSKPWDPHIRQHNIHDAETHDTSVHGHHKSHRGSPDNVHPLTRFGLWLFMKDCPGVLTNVTLAEYDRAWNGVSSISFQTKHNPFEPVYLQQFLQCLIIMAQIIYYEVPKRMERKKARKLASKASLVDLPTASPVDSYTRIITSQTSLIGEAGEGWDEAEHLNEHVPSTHIVATISGAHAHAQPTKPKPKPKPKPLPFQRLAMKTKSKPEVTPVKPELTPSKKAFVGVKGKQDPKKSPGAKKGSKGEPITGRPETTETEISGEGKSETDHEEETAKMLSSVDEDEIEGETTTEHVKTHGKHRSVKKLKGGKKEKSNKALAAEKTSKVRHSIDSGEKSRKISDSSNKLHKDTHEIEEATEHKAESKEGSEHTDHKSKPVDSKKSSQKVKGNKGEKKGKTGSFKKAKAEEAHAHGDGTPPSAESEEHGHHEAAIPEHEGSNVAHHPRKSSDGSEPGEHEHEHSRDDSAESDHKGKKGKKGSEHKDSGHAEHHKGKGRNASVGKINRKKSKTRRDSVGSGKSKYDTEHHHEKNSAELEHDESVKKQSLATLSSGGDEEEEMGGGGDDEAHEKATLEHTLKNKKTKFWTRSEVQLNTEERMYGWTAANRDKCKKHLVTQAAKVKVVQPGTTDVKISQLLERLLGEILLPCLDRAPGMFLPEVPDPLPPLADLYFSFSNTYGHKEVINAMDFTQSMLPHLLYPNKNDAIFWTRTKNLKSPQIDLDFVLGFSKKIGLQGDETALGEDFLGEKLANTNIFSEEIKDTLHAQAQVHAHARGSFAQDKRCSIDIIGGGNRVFGDDVDGASVLMDPIPVRTPRGSDTGISRTNSLENLDVEFPFSERDLAPEPFLWDRDTKCLHVAKREHAFRNLTAEDIVSVLRNLYPQIIGRAAETNMGFELSFCDWLWATAMVAKTSADRAYYMSMKFSSKTEHPHRRHHHPNHYGFHPNQMPPPSSAEYKGRKERGMSVFHAQSTLTNLREKYTRSDLHKSNSTNYIQVLNPSQTQVQVSKSKTETNKRFI